MTVDRRGFVIRSGAGAAGLTIGLSGCGTGDGAQGVGAEEWPADPDALEARYRDNVYTRLLGVRPHLPAHEHVSRLGGGRMDAEVIAAMAEANEFFVDMNELLGAAGGADRGAARDGGRACHGGRVLGHGARGRGLPDRHGSGAGPRTSTPHLAAPGVSDPDAAPVRIRPGVPGRGDDDRRGGDAGGLPRRPLGEDGDDRGPRDGGTPDDVRASGPGGLGAGARARSHDRARADRDRARGGRPGARGHGIGPPDRGGSRGVRRGGRRLDRDQRRQGDRRPAVVRHPRRAGGPRRSAPV